MAELTINHIIKIILGILVFAVIVISATFAFRNYIMPYFEGISPAEEPPNLDTAYYKELMKPENLVGLVKNVDGENYLHTANGQKTAYYLSGRSPKKLYKSVDWALDPLVGLIGSDGKLRISDDYKADAVLLEVNLAEKIGNELYLIKS